MAEISDSERSEIKIVNPSQWPYDRAKKINFDVWLLDENNMTNAVANEICSHADPKNGRFVFYWVRGYELNFDHIKSCRIDDGKSLTWVYHGIFDGPSLCTTINDYTTKRIYIEFNTVYSNDTIALPKEQTAPLEKTTENTAATLVDRFLDSMRPR